MKKKFIFKIFIGYDSRETIAYHVLSHSIISKSTIPVTITPIRLENLKSFYNRKKGKKDSTEFSMSRFLTPYLSNFEGYSLFLDCDFIVNADIADLFKVIKKDSNKTIWCVKHKNYRSKVERKFLNERQLPYEKKNWSSFVVYNNAKCKMLTPSFVSKSNGLFLHQFKWIKDNQIGSLPKEWNILVGEQKILKNFKALHFTLGGPYFKKYKKTKGSIYWYRNLKNMNKGLEKSF